MNVIKNIKSKKQAVVALGAVLALFLSREVFAALPEGVAPPPFASDRVLVAFQPGTPAAEVAKAHGRAGAQVIETIEAIGVQVVAVPPGTVLERVDLYQRNPNVQFAEPDYNHVLVLPIEGTDSVSGIHYWDEQWALHNTGQLFYCLIPGFCFYFGTPDADIDAPAAWDITPGSPDVKIAVLDSSVSCNHVDLFGKCVVEQVDIVIPPDDPAGQTIGHGTHVAGIAAAKTDNGVGIAGVGWNTSIGSFRVCYETYLNGSPVGLCPVSASAQAITNAADKGYHVINMSYGSDPRPYRASATEQAAVDYAWNQGVVLVAAAGNDGSTRKVYPAAFNHVIAVAATDEDDFLASFSNYGRRWVDIAAPGNVILSTLPGSFCGIPENHPEGCYDWYSGTSMAAPHVAGAAALVWEQLLATDIFNGTNNATNARVRSILEGTTDNPTGFHDPSGVPLTNWIAHGRLNLCKAVAAAGGVASPDCEGGVP